MRDDCYSRKYVRQNCNEMVLNHAMIPSISLMGDSQQNLQSNMLITLKLTMI